MKCSTHNLITINS